MVLQDAYDVAQQVLSEQVRPGVRDEVVINHVSEHLHTFRARGHLGLRR